MSYVDFLREHGGLLSLDFMARLDHDFAAAGVGGVTGPGSSVVGDVVVWQDTLGKQLGDGGALGALARLNTIGDAYWSGGPLAVIHGGTGATDAGGAAISLGLGALSLLNTITASYVTDLDTHTRALTAAQLVAGANVTITPSGSPSGTVLTIAASLAGGTVSGPGSSVNGELVLFNGTSGGNIQGSGGTIPSANGLSLISAANYAAMKTLMGFGSLASQSSITASQISDPSNLKPPQSIIIAISDETTALTTGTAKVTFRMPYAFTLTSSGVRASLTTVSSSGLPQFDIKKSGVSILSTKITIDVSEKTSTTAATPPVLSSLSLADDEEITIDILNAGTGAAGAKIYLIGART